MSSYYICRFNWHFSFSFNWECSLSYSLFSSTGGYYTLPIEDTNLDAVVLNTNLYYTSNDLVDGTGDPAGQFQWLDDLLTAKAQENRKVKKNTRNFQSRKNKPKN